MTSLEFLFHPLVLLHVAVCLALGIASNFFWSKRGWTWFLIVFWTDIVLFSWHGIDIQRDGLLRTIWMIVSEGTFWWMLLSLGVGGLPFLAGRGGYQFFSNFRIRQGVIEKDEGVSKRTLAKNVFPFVGLAWLLFAVFYSSDLMNAVQDWLRKRDGRIGGFDTEGMVAGYSFFAFNLIAFFILAYFIYRKKQSNPN